MGLSLLGILKLASQSRTVCAENSFNNTWLGHGSGS